MNQDFKIQIPITRAYKDENGDMLFEGTASSTSVDSHETMFNEEAQAGFEEDVNGGISRGEPVELESEHNGDDEPMNILGPVISAEVIDNTKLKIIARLDQDNPKAVYYYNKMTKKDPITGKTKQFGLSINGNVISAHYEFNAQLGKTIRVFDRVKLKRVGIVRKPSNPDSWIEKLIRSVEWENVETKERSEKQMSKDTENQESVVEATETRNDENPAEVTESVETVAETQVENTEVEQEVVEVANNADVTTEAAPDEVVVQDAQEQEPVDRNDDAASDENVEQVNRADWWTSGSLMAAIGNTLNCICELEILTKYDNEKLNEGMTEEAVVKAKELFTKLQEVLADHVMVGGEMDESEERSDVEQSEAVENVERVDDSANQNMDNVVEAVSAVLDGEYTDKVKELIRSAIDEKFGELKFAEVEAVESLKRNLEALSKENAELVERLEKVESEPASAPGAQLLETVSRSKAAADKKAENIARATKEGDTGEIIKHKLWKDKYLGYGEFV